MATTKTPKFLRTLYTLLDVEAAAIISWSHCGTFFQVFDILRLEQDVLPRYFKHNKFASFQRQLSTFGFRKWTKTRASVCTFSHDSLVRCKPSELGEMMNAHASAIPTSSQKRPRNDLDMESIVAKKSKCAPEQERASETDVADLLALDWCILTGDNQHDEILNEVDDDDCVGLPIELFFPHENTAGDFMDLEPLSCTASRLVDGSDWRLLAECLAKTKRELYVNSNTAK